ncbi:MAG TPA: DUF4260 domain-containing protein [Candidatus Limnocylindrales bacterium]|nr:DUF4260 domain-containing protein [Candidatus Limnocylindrales bacterium]
MTTSTTATITRHLQGEGRPLDAGMVGGAVRRWLQLEGLAAFAAGLVLYAMAGGTWLVILPLLLVPDASMIGYLRGPRAGAFVYNLVHTWAAGIVVLGLAVVTGSAALQIAGAVLIAHVGMDRALGYGLKLPTAFGDTHLGRIGRPNA